MFFEFSRSKSYNFFGFFVDFQAEYKSLVLSYIAENEAHVLPYQSKSAWNRVVSQNLFSSWGLSIIAMIETACTQSSK